MAEIVFSITAAAIYHAALLLREEWIALATQASAPSSYLRGLSTPQSIHYPAGDPLSAEVINVAPHADHVEIGSPAYHLPAVIQWPTAKTRRSKAGVYYLIIPFRHGSPRARQTPMPRRVYQVARQLQAGQFLTGGPSHGRAVHAPGLQPYAPANPLNVRPGFQHRSLYEGMRRTPAARGRGGSYLTFRTMTPQSPGWRMPAQPGLHIAAQVSQQMTPTVTRMIEQAIQQDMEAALRQRLGG